MDFIISGDHSLKLKTKETLEKYSRLSGKENEDDSNVIIAAQGVDLNKRKEPEIWGETRPSRC